MNSIFADNIPDAYAKAIVKLHRWGNEEESRNGPVITSPDPVFLCIRNPRERVLFDAVRDCNPFFHVMEFVWMMAGENDVRWIEQFNKGFRNYADTNTNTLHGAYGHRWTNHFSINQIQAVAELLKVGRTTRRAVISMWDPTVDLSSHNDLPCNTSIMFRYVESSGLNMLVVNRSNDLIWGMLGANAVHMTYLHELVAHEANLPMGNYQVLTNNLHIYKNMPRFEEIWSTTEIVDHYSESWYQPMKLLTKDENYSDLYADCKDMVCNPPFNPRTHWMQGVALPMYRAYMERLRGEDGIEHIDRIEAPDWKRACYDYVKRRGIVK